MQNWWLILLIVVISTLVAVIARAAKALNSMNEMNSARNRQQARASSGGKSGGGVVRQGNSDMDRFLAEIDRLRKKNVDAPSASTTPKKTPPVALIVQPVKQPDRPRARVVAELADPVRPDTGFALPTLTVPAAPGGPKPSDLPFATVVAPPSGTGAPATRVTKIAGRPRPVAKTPFAKNITGLLNSGQGLAMAIVLQEILGPPKSQKRG
jgi:type II secretory pathway pseudopilin PulG